MLDASFYDDETPAKQAEAAPSVYWAAPTPFNPAAGTAGPALLVYANEGRWIVACDAAGCGGAQLASQSDPRFMCESCGNATNQGRWRPLAWPAERPAIEAALEVRDDLTAQNWVPGEAVAALVAENDAAAADPVAADPVAAEPVAAGPVVVTAEPAAAAEPVVPTTKGGI